MHHINQELSMLDFHLISYNAHDIPYNAQYGWTLLSVTLNSSADLDLNLESDLYLLCLQL